MAFLSRRRTFPVVCLLIPLLLFLPVCAQSAVTPVYDPVLTYTASVRREEIEEGEDYLLLIVREAAPGRTLPELDADSILYIDQKTAKAGGNIVFDAVCPKDYDGGYVFVSGKGFKSPLFIGTLAYYDAGSDLNTDGIVNVLDAILFAEKITEGEEGYSVDGFIAFLRKFIK